MAGTYDAEDLLPRMARILAEGTGAQHTGVWLATTDEIHPVAAWPPGTGLAPAVPLAGRRLPDLPGASRTIPVRHQGELLGALGLTTSAGDRLSPAEEKLVSDFAAQAGLVLHNVRLIEDLKASRQRVVQAQDAERRRIERDIHDGAQQQLVALAVKMGLARTMVDRSPDAAAGLIDQLKSEAQQALNDLRDLARGIYPPLLADQGLEAALSAQARRSAIEVTVNTNDVGRLPQDVEAAVYFCVLEALQNIGKYAQASHVEVRLRAEDRQLLFEVVDDGRGFDPQTTGQGSGLQNMADRLAALGGDIEVTSAPGAGTTVAGRVPVASEAVR
jgi:signal transduction histidine kinase